MEESSYVFIISSRSSKDCFGNRLSQCSTIICLGLSFFEIIIIPRCFSTSTIVPKGSNVYALYESDDHLY